MPDRSKTRARDRNDLATTCFPNAPISARGFESEETQCDRHRSLLMKEQRRRAASLTARFGPGCSFSVDLIMIRPRAVIFCEQLVKPAHRVRGVAVGWNRYTVQLKLPFTVSANPSAACPSQSSRIGHPRIDHGVLNTGVTYPILHPFHVEPLAQQMRAARMLQGLLILLMICAQQRFAISVIPSMV